MYLYVYVCIYICVYASPAQPTSQPIFIYVYVLSKAKQSCVPGTALLASQPSQPSQLISLYRYMYYQKRSKAAYPPSRYHCFFSSFLIDCLDINWGPWAPDLFRSIKFGVDGKARNISDLRILGWFRISPGLLVMGYRLVGPATGEPNKLRRR